LVNDFVMILEGQENNQQVRLFAAVLLPEHVLFALNRAQALIAESLKYSSRKIPHENLHVTMSFFGNVQQSKLSALKSILAQVKCKKISIKVEKIEARRHGGRAGGLIWARIADHQDLSCLKAAIDQAVFFDKEREQAEFIPHVTLFRLRHVAQISKLERAISDLSFVPLFFTIDSFSLMQSIQSPSGSHYLELARFSFESC
jgi:2'-5' RNA ligase